ncbi:hypothetical protein DPMN_181926 [Dreissena polymorpha]|uniref:Uncharacterized protein n=1 Tax=Dreissena polymorpha TaxID=45954 RepID=A0A9D4DH45_DREPO|nr:hypothetical protein DPMN_181926 [Dreissena polymorpha]
MIGQKLKTAPPTSGHVFQRIGTTFELNQDIIKTNTLTNFELGRDFIGTKLLTKFHEDGTINVASRVFTSKSKKGWLTTNQRLDWTNFYFLTKFYKDLHINVAIRALTRLQPYKKNSPTPWFSTDRKHFSIHPRYHYKNLLTKLHKDLNIHLTSRVFTRKTVPPPGLHVFQQTRTIFLHGQDIIITNVLTNASTSFQKMEINILTKFHKDWMKAINILTKFHKDWMKTVTSTVYTNKLLTDTRTHIRTPDFTPSHKLTMSLLDRKTAQDSLFHEDMAVNVASTMFTNILFNLT